MAGQVDVIVSQKAIAEIQVATAQLEQLRIKILAVNKAGASSKVGGVGGNKEITDQLIKLNQLTAANNKLTAAANKRLVAINKNTSAMKRSTASTKRATKGIKLMQTALATISVTMLAMKLWQFGKDIFTLAKAFDSLGFAMIKTSKSLNDAAMNTRFMLNLSKDLGLSLVATTTRFIKFAAAANNSGMAMKDTQKIFATMAKAGSVLGLKVDELGGVFLALEQMLSKGKVTTEELRRQLGERLPGAFGIMAASLDVTLPQLDKMLKAGEILSADVLPGFADAVEIAFGLDTVDKIDTLVAAQNRSTTAWENFVKGITGSESVIQRTFKSILDWTADFYNGMNMMHNEEAALAHLRTSNAFDQQEHDIKEHSKIVLDSRRKEGKKLADLDKEILDAKADLEKNINSDIADERLRLAVAAKIEYNKALGIIEQEDAASQFAQRFADVQEQQAIVDSITKTDTGTTDKFGKSIAYYTKEDVILLEKATEELQKRQGILDATRLIGEKSKIAEKEEDGTLSKAGSKDIKDLERDKQIQALRERIEFGKRSIEIDELNAEERLSIAKDNANDLSAIAELTLEQTLEDNEKKRVRMISAIQKDMDNKKKIVIDGEGKIAEINKHFDDAEILATNKATTEKQKANNDFYDTTEKEQEKALKRRLALSDKNFDDLRIEAKAAFDLGLTDWDVYQKVLTEIARQESNARIDILIEEQIIRNKTLSGEALSQGEAVLSSLKAGKKSADPDTDTATQKEKNTAILEEARNFSAELSNLGNAIFDRKIAQIDEEIRREEDKYAILFALAEGDDEQQRLLAIQQEEDSQKLEKKKRKIQKDQAKFNKASALVDIAINTAIGISAVTATGPLGLALIPIIAALGALQIATVLAQPIPAFAEGGIMGHDGPALVGDGGKREVIRNPDGSLMITPSTNTVMNLQKGSEIFSSIDKFNSENPQDLNGAIHSASLLASISLNQKNIDGLLSSQRELDERLLQEMIKNTKAVNNSKSSTFVKTQSIDIPHEMWKNKYLS